MQLKTRALAALGVGGFLSLPASAALFNLAPGVAVPLSGLVCSERLQVVSSTRHHSHTYLCGGADVTVFASLVTWVALVLVLALLLFMALPGRGKRPAE